MQKFRGRTAMSRAESSQGVYSYGMPVFPLAGTRFKGDVWHVDSGHANKSNNNKGDDPNRPLATLDAAIGKCTANNGDVILVSEGHAETLTAAAAVALDVAGVTIIGLGAGETRPIFTFGTNNAASFDVTAANCWVENLLFKNDKDGQTAMLNITAKDFTLLNCELREGSAKQPVLYINIGAANNDADRCKLYGNRILAVTAGATSAISLTQLQDSVEIVGNYIDGDFDDAGIQNPTGEICTNLLIKGNFVRNRQTGDHAIQLVSACTGACLDNRLAGDTLGTILDPGSLLCAGNLEVDAIDQAGVASPVTAAGGLGIGAIGSDTFQAGAIDATAIATGAIDADALAADTVLGADNNNNAFASTNVVANEDGSLIERLEQVQEAVNKGTGTALAANKSLVDALGTDGTTVTDAAASVLGALGADNANNAFASTSVVSNVDGSVLERLEHLAQVNTGGAAATTSNPLLGIKVTKATADVFAAANTPLFTVSGGRVLVTHLEGEVTTIIGAGANNFKLQANPTVGTTVDMCAVLDIDADEVGTLWTLHGAPATALQRGESGSAPGMAIRGVVVPEGQIEANSAGNVTGSAQWELWYFPLDSGASVASA